MTLSERAGREVVQLHEFFETWMGSDDGGDAAFDRAEAVLADDFEMVSPSGHRRDGTTVRADLRGARGTFAASDPPFHIRVADVGTRFEDNHGEFCLVTYEEWQRHDGDWEGRLSSALFRRDGDAPNGVEWVHLHETWLPDEADPPTG